MTQFGPTLCAGLVFVAAFVISLTAQAAKRNPIRHKNENRQPAKAERLGPRVIPLGNDLTEKQLLQENSCPDCRIPKRK